MQELKKRGKPAGWDMALALRLYRAGKTDREVADAVGVSRKTVTNWRNRIGMPPHHAKKGPGRRVDYEEMRRLYDLGLSSSEIQYRMKVSYGTIRSWLIKNNLPSCGIQTKGKQEPIGIPGETPARTNGQKMYMTDSEILSSMRRCENRREQVQILADLNACGRAEMLKYLEAIGEDVSDLQRKRKGKINHAKAMELWEGGASDAGIAHCMGVTVRSVAQWRERYGLINNCKEARGNEIQACN